jgi:3',5'-cyclic AMP phosphodiesterase CpdA
MATVLLLVTGLVGSMVVEETPPRIVPPAGEALEGAPPFRFAVISDTRGNMSVFEEALVRIKQEQPSLILHAGDIAQRYTRRQFNWLLHELEEARLTVPFCPVPGNHDVNDEARDASERYRLYEWAFGPRRYWFSYANALFVAFDDSNERCDEDDLQWLDATLARLRGSYDACFVYMHVPPRDPEPGGRHALRERDAERLAEVLQRHNVTTVFCGHLHSYAEDTIAGIPVFITGGAGEQKKTDEPHHYLICTVAPDGSATVARRDVPAVANEDYPDYVLYTKVPWRTALALAAAIALAASAMPVHRREPESAEHEAHPEH